MQSGANSNISSPTASVPSSAASPSTTTTTGSATQQWTDRIPLAPNMATLLFHLRDIPFSCMQDRVKGSTAHERTPSLYVLMRTLTAQAEHDGFRLITINTEAKRIIMACNRQGKPPPVKPEDPSATEETKKRSGRSGTSMRCECRCRVNINFHSKMCAWRVTSFEANHNHSYGEAADEDPNAEPQTEKIAEGYTLNMENVQRAIASMERAVGGNNTAGSTTGNTDMDAAHLLAELAGSPQPQRRTSMACSDSPMTSLHHHQHRHSIAEIPVHTTSSGSPGLLRLPNTSEPNTNGQSPRTSEGEPSPVSATNRSNGHMEYRPLAAKSASSLTGNGSYPNSYANSQFIKTEGVPIATMRRVSEPQALAPRVPIYPAPVPNPTTPYSPQQQQQQISPRMYAQQAQYQHQQQLHQQHLAEMKSVALTAIEIDRYAMLHSQCKRMISIACKRREWTEDVLAGIGRFLESMQQASTPSIPQPLPQQQSPPQQHQTSPQQATSDDMQGVEKPTLDTIPEEKQEKPQESEKPRESQQAIPTSEPTKPSPEMVANILVSPPISTKEPSSVMETPKSPEKRQLECDSAPLNPKEIGMTDDMGMPEQAESCLPSPKRQAREVTV